MVLVLHLQLNLQYDFMVEKLKVLENLVTAQEMSTEEKEELERNYLSKILHHEDDVIQSVNGFFSFLKSYLINR